MILKKYYERKLSEGCPPELAKPEGMDKRRLDLYNAEEICFAKATADGASPPPTHVRSF